MKHKTLFGILASVFYLAFMALVIVLPIVLVKADNSVPAKATFIVFNCLYLTGLFAYLMGLIVKGDDFYRNFPLNMAVPAKMYPIFFVHLLASSLMFAFVPFGYSWISLIVEFVLLVVFALVIAKVGVGAAIVKDQQDQTKAKVDWINTVKGKVSLMKGGRRQGRFLDQRRNIRRSRADWNRAGFQLSGESGRGCASRKRDLRQH
jgi:hypothetical protein